MTVRALGRRVAFDVFLETSPGYEPVTTLNISENQHIYIYIYSDLKKESVTVGRWCGIGECQGALPDGCIWCGGGHSGPNEASTHHLRSASHTPHISETPTGPGSELMTPFLHLSDRLPTAGHLTHCLNNHPKLTQLPFLEQKLEYLEYSFSRQQSLTHRCCLSVSRRLTLSHRFR